MMYQEILYELKPDMIIETGSEYGGSTLFFASICDMIGKGEVISIDRDHSRITATHPRITWVEGNSVCTETVARVRSAARDMGTIIVTLDSSHIKGHVLKEMELYATFVTPGSYLIVEDTKQNGHPIQTYYPPDYGPGPMEAVEDFLINHKEFRVDRSREKYLLTSNPGGFLRRIG
jgi:cephalosporin hydroxylase